MSSRHKALADMENKRTDVTGPGLIEAEIKVINVGLANFAFDLQECGVEAVHVDWRPPAGADPELAEILAEMGA